MNCRHCASELRLPFVDLGRAPPSNAYLDPSTPDTSEKSYPLRIMVCENCWLVQTEDFAEAGELFDEDYAYFSSFSTTWLAHAERYVKEMTERFELDARSHVVEVAANDGYLLQYFQSRGIPCLGIEPTASTAAAALNKGLDIIEAFFGLQLAEKLAGQEKTADLTAANNVLAHVPDINDFVSGFAHLLKPDGVSTFEFPHLLKLIEENQFDTIYHEHFSYLSFTATDRIFAANGLNVFDVEEISTHGGSLRVFAQRSDTGKRVRETRVDELQSREEEAGMTSATYYAGFQVKTDKVRDDFLGFLDEAQRDQKTVAAYGAAAKGNTLMNYAGVREGSISFVVDRNPAKQGKLMPGSHIPIVGEDRLMEAKPDYVLILPWNLKAEIMEQLDYIRNWGGRYATAVPELRVEP